MSAESPSSTTPIEVIVLNGASSSGKTTLAAALQDILEESWLVFGIDTLISALPLDLLEIHDDATRCVRAGSPSTPTALSRWASSFDASRTRGFGVSPWLLLPACG
jgi:hypothetical protein